MAGTHSTFAPSSAHRVVHCPASLRACKDEPDSPGIEAVHGTVAHYIHEFCLNDGRGPERFIGMHPVQFMPEDELSPAEWALIPYSRGVAPDTDFIIDEPFALAIEESLQWCREVPGEHFVEQRVDISPWCPVVYLEDELGELVLDEKGNKIVVPQKGTADHFAFEPGVLTITDLKFGTGVQVFAEKNYQAICYALGVVNDYGWMHDFDRVVIRIAQPRLHHFDVWETTLTELLEIGEYIKERFTLAMQPNAPYGPDEHGCKFCPINHKCKALTDKVTEMFDFDLDELTDAAEVRLEAEFLTLERQVEIFKMRGLMKLWIGAIEADIATRLSRDPESVPGLKLVAGRSSRYWIKPERARDELSMYIDEDKLVTKPELISPAQAEKLLKKGDKAVVSLLADKRPGKPTIVDANDKRPKWEGPNALIAMSQFEDESDE